MDRVGVGEYHARLGAPRLDPLGILPILHSMTAQEIGEFAYPFVRATSLGTADVTTRHILDLIGWELSCREDSV